MQPKLCVPSHAWAAQSLRVFSMGLRGDAAQTFRLRKFGGENGRSSPHADVRPVEAASSSGSEVTSEDGHAP